MNLKMDNIKVGDVIFYRENIYSFYPVAVLAINEKHPAILVSEHGSWLLFEPYDLFDEKGMNDFILSGYDTSLLTRD